MNERKEPVEVLPELTEQDKAHITEIFNEDVVPKLRFMNARTGVLNCEFAGEEYVNWNIVFKEVGSDFQIIEFESEDEGRGITFYG